MKNKIIVKSNRIGKPTEIIINHEQAKEIAVFMNGLRLGMLEADRMVENILEDIQTCLNFNHRKMTFSVEPKDNKKFLSAFIVVEQYAMKLENHLYMYENVYEMLVEKIEKLTGIKIDIEDTNF